MPILNMVGGGKKGGNIGEPLNLTVTTSGLDATIKWEDNEIGTIPPTTFQKSELVRKIGSAPTSPSDGDLVVTETVKDTYKVSGYVDSGLTDGTTYYYRVFSYSDLGGISYCDAVSVTPSPGWQPGANTVMYFPFIDDQLDKVGSSSIPVTGTQQTIGYNFSFSNSVSLTNPDTTCAFVSFRIKVNSAGTYGQTPSTYVGNVMYNYSHSISAYAQKFQIQSTPTGNEWSTQQTVSSGTWYHIAMGYNGTNVVAYLNGVKAWDTASNEYSGYNMIRLGSDMDMDLSQRIGESVCWTDQEVSDYFNQTKGDYGIS